MCLRLQARRPALHRPTATPGRPLRRGRTGAGDSFHADWRITDLIRHAQQREAPDPGVVCPDDGPEFTALQDQVRAALEKEPRKEPDLAPPSRPRHVRGLHHSQLMTTVCRAGAPPQRGRRPLQWKLEMTMETNPTALLLELAAQARNMNDPDALRDVLSAGHRAWCEGIADVQASIGRQTAPLSDADVAERCAAAGTPWEEGTARSEAVAALAFATWDASPAAMAYTELAERAARFGVCLLGEDVL
ncbi:hypothetical protein [Streptomyces xylophagus]|uniref:hypothetical protein n=1 Tax=Streptomyces xylophagus TaxID=285514 RepID=UPI00131D703E|nr:hypothetical protein [Streptomyces xylophagus]